MKFYNRIVFKISFFLIVVIMIPLILGVVILSNKSIDDAEKRALEKNSMIANSYKSVIDQRLYGIEKAFHTFSNQLIPGEKSLDELELILINAVEVNDLISEMFILDQTGEKIVKTAGKFGNRADRTYFKRALQGDEYFSNVIISRSTEIPIIVFAHPIYDQDEVVGVMAGVIELETIKDILVDSSKNLDLHAYLIDGNGLIIAHPNVNEMYKNSVQVDDFSNEYYGSFKKEIDGKPYLTTFVQSDISSWKVIVEESQTDAYKNRNEYFGNLLVLILFAIITLTIGIAMVVKYYYLPLKEIEDALPDSDDKDFTFDVSNEVLNRDDELGYVSKVLSDLFDYLRELLTKNNEYNLKISNQLLRVEILNRKLKKSYAEVNAIVSATEDGFFSFDLKSKRIETTDNAIALMGENQIAYSSGEFAFMKNLSIESAKDFKGEWESIIEDEKHISIIDIRYILNQNEFVYQMTIHKYYEPINGDPQMVVAIKDITKEVKQGEVLYERLYKHPVTGMNNRNAIVDVIDDLMKKEESIQVMVIDIDGFRYINGSFGYETGNMLLQKVRDILLEERDYYIDIAHLEVDRYCLVLKNDSDINQITDMFNKRLTKIYHDDNEYLLTGSSGIASSTNAKNADELIMNAEIALLQAKEAGLNSYMFYSDTYKLELNERLGMMNHLKRAIDFQELYVVFQPIVDSNEDEVIGYESLARWRSPQYGNVPPNIFINMAEDIGFIADIGDFICKEAFKFSKIINEDLNRKIVSINLSPKQFRQTNFVENFLSLIKEYQVDPSTIAVEITENVYIENLVDVKNVLEKLRSEGIKVYLDDFGTGYSSLSYIENLPIDVLKIDKTFVDKLESSNSSKMISVFRTLADSFGMNVIAEGVETKEQLSTLNDMGCTFIQGYYYSRPLSVEHVLEYEVE